MKQLYKSTLLLVITVCFSSILAFNSYADCNPKGDQVSYGSNNRWTGYVYQGTSFNTYKGYVTEGIGSDPNFDQSFGGNQVYYSTNGCDVYTDNFSVRYKLAKSFNGYYTFTVGGDDGYRLSLDGGNTWVINNWNVHSYTTTSYAATLNGTYNMVLEYYESYGDNRISFSVTSSCLGVGDPDTYGTNNVWQVHLFQGKNFDTYKGYVTEGNSFNPNFDENFGSSNGNFSTNSCAIQTENFSARFRLQTTLAPATYVITVGGDDGYRLSLDGGNTWVVNEWKLQTYTVKSYTATLSGAYNLVLEYYENGGDNRISFSMSSSATLPVKLTGLSAKAVAADKVQVSWNTAEEINFDHFNVQRSTNGQSFRTIATVAGQGANSTIEHSYQYTDQFAYSGTVYYRLEMTDKDGSTEYSAIVTASLNTVSTTAKIYPTLVENGTLYVEVAGNTQNGKVEIFDMNGRMLLSKHNITAGSRQQLILNSGRTAAGSYIVRVTGDQELIAQKMIIIK